MSSGIQVMKLKCSAKRKRKMERLSLQSSMDIIRLNNILGKEHTLIE